MDDTNSTINGKRLTPVESRNTLRVSFIQFEFNESKSRSSSKFDRGQVRFESKAPVIFELELGSYSNFQRILPTCLGDDIRYPKFAEISQLSEYIVHSVVSNSLDLIHSNSSTFKGYPFVP